MSKSTGLSTRLYVNGYDLSGDVSAINSIADSQALQDVTGLDDAAIGRLALVADGAVSINGWFNASALQEHAGLLVSGKVPTGDRGVLIPLEITLGGACFYIVSKESSYSINRGADGSLAIASEFASNGFGIEWGKLLTAPKTTAVSSTNGASVDDAAATTAGATAIVQVFSLASGTVIPVIEDSANDSTFAAITGLTFTGVGTAGVPSSERLATAATATIRRYVRLALTGTFTTAVVACGFKRG